MENPRLPQTTKDSECSQEELYFLEVFSILERYVIFIYPYHVLVLRMAEREEKHLTFYRAKPSYIRLMPAEMFPQLKWDLRSLHTLDRMFNFALTLMFPAILF